MISTSNIPPWPWSSNSPHWSLLRAPMSNSPRSLDPLVTDSVKIFQPPKLCLLAKR